MPKTKFKSKLEELFGARCPEPMEGCAVCSAWQLYDDHQWGKLLKLFVDIEEFVSTKEPCHAVE